MFLKKHTLLGKHPPLRDLIFINPHLLFVIEISSFEISCLVTFRDSGCGSGRSGFRCSCGWLF